MKIGWRIRCPALRQLGTNWFGYANTTASALGGAAQGAYTYLTTTVPQSLKTAFQQIADGNLSGAATTINDALGSAIFTIGLPLFPLLAIPGQMADNFTAVVKAVTGLDTLVPLLLGGLGPIEGGIQSFGDSAQAVLDAAQEGDAVSRSERRLCHRSERVGSGHQRLSGQRLPRGCSQPQLGGLVYSLVVTVPRAIATALGATAPRCRIEEGRAQRRGGGDRRSGTTESSSGTAQSKLAAAPAAGDAVDLASGSSAAVKDGNKFEPGQVSGSGAAGARSAAASSNGAAANAGDAKGSTTGATGKGRSARHAAGGDN